MPLSKPYKRISRPLQLPYGYIDGNTPEDTYIADNRYAPDRFEIIRGYHILERDLIKLFEYIEPHDNNLNVFSHRTYELLLRASTEFELNCKKVLQANNYAKGGTWNIGDYFRINSAMKLSEYKVCINIWANNRKEFTPLAEWNNASSLCWYQAYNRVKHDRHGEFLNASLDNVLNAVSAVLCIVVAQFNIYAFYEYQSPRFWFSGPEISSEDGLFSLKLPDTWTDHERYHFSWQAVSGGATPFSDFAF
ncbi:MAG TPA: hypothetical protein VNS32_19990 [Flavisolibacter sp.]|nr:hypothetical protein [Flavisolibacter sp.]HWJ89756.1 hypothetical protein [Flavisolibacter sp.]